MQGSSPEFIAPARDASPRIILVTGAAGFIGGHVTRRLAREAGIAVRAGTRAAPVKEAPNPSTRIDVLDPAALRHGLAGVDTVVHCAVGDRATTVEGTRNVLQAARHAGVRRVVHLSSIAVYGAASGLVDEDRPVVATEGPGYAHWKAAAEAACRDAAEVETIILRPTIVYGAGSELWVGRMARRILSGRWGSFGPGGEGICNLLHVADLAEAVLAAIRVDGGAPGATFNINGPVSITWNDWFAHLASALGQPEPPARTPATWRRRRLASLPAKALIRAVPATRRLFANYLLGAPAAGELELFALKATYPTTRAQSRLGWRPRVGLAEGMENSLSWLQAEGIAR